METIKAIGPKTLADIKAGEIYEEKLFTSGMLSTLMVIWVIRRGTIQDPGPKQGVKVIQFVRER